MTIYQLEILNPNAKSLLEELEKLGLIKVTQTALSTQKQDFKNLLNKLRSSNSSVPSLEEITKEVEIVRKKRYDKKGK
jgi:hypothetical protein